MFSVTATYYSLGIDLKRDTHSQGSICAEQGHPDSQSGISDCHISRLIDLFLN